MLKLRDKDIALERGMLGDEVGCMTERSPAAEVIGWGAAVTFATPVATSASKERVLSACSETS